MQKTNNLSHCIEPERLNSILPILYLCLFIFLVTSAKAQLKGKNAPGQTYTNPVLNTIFADPAVIKAPDGWYYAYATRTWHEEKEMIHLQVARSRDLVHWDYLPDAMPVKPFWADSTTEFWAPDIQYDADSKTYYLYIASGHNGSREHCIGVLTSSSPTGPFTDMGKPLVCGPGYTHIDPMVFQDPKTGRRYILWGSDHAPIQMQEMKGWTQLKPGSKPIDLLLPTKKQNNYDNMIEGPWLIYTKGYYYLFFSGDNCCGPKSHYAVMVARAKKITGPYEKFKGVDGSGNGVILELNSHFDAPGHNAVITTNNGKQYWMLYHAIDPKDRFQSKKSPVGMTFDKRVLLLDQITFKDGWPRIKDNSPSFVPRPAPVPDNPE